MPDLLDFIGRFAPFLALGALLAAIVLAINVLGRRWERHEAWLATLDVRLERRWEKHEAWLATLDVRVDNLHKDRRATWARRLQHPAGDDGSLDVTEKAPLVPPPLPPRAPTLNASDWDDELLATEELQTKATGRYPSGHPPKEPNDDDP